MEPEASPTDGPVVEGQPIKKPRGPRPKPKTLADHVPSLSTFEPMIREGTPSDRLGLIARLNDTLQLIRSIEGQEKLTRDEIDKQLSGNTKQQG